MSWFANAVDNVGTALKLPEIGLSEWLSGGKKTTNTGSKEYMGATSGAGSDGKGQPQIYQTFQQALNSGGGSKGSGATSGGNAQNTATTGNGGIYSGGGGGGSAASAAQLAEYENAIGQLNHGLGRLDNQLGIALGNVNSQFTTRSNELASSLGKAQGQYSNQTTQNQQQRRNNINSINDQSAAGLRGLMRSLGSNGAVGSDLQLGGRAVQDQANAQRAGAGQAYSQNQQTLDTGWGNFQKDIEDETKKVNDWKSQQESSARAQSQSTRQSLLNQLAQVKSQQATARGANGANAARADLSRANALSAEIDGLARLNPSYTGQSMNYTPQSLDSYSVGGSTAVGVNDPTGVGGDPTLGIYGTRATEEDERLKRGQYL